MDKRLRLFLRRLPECLADCAFLVLSYAFSGLLLAYFLKTPSSVLPELIKSWPGMAVGCVVSFVALGVYRALWSYISLMHLVRISAAAWAAAFWAYVCMRVTAGYWQPPIVGVTSFYLFLTMCAGFRLLPTLMKAAQRYTRFRLPGSGTAVLVVGAGEAADALLKDFENAGDGCPYRVAGLIDDDEKKHGLTLRGARVLGAVSDIPDLAKQLRVEQIIVAIPSASTEQRKRILDACVPTGCRVRSMAAVARIGEATVGNLHDIDIADLLGREEVALDPSAMAAYITGAVVLVTGGGGSIGSELCRQIMRYDPKKLVILDFYENNADGILQELRVKFREKADRVSVRIGSVQDFQRLTRVFAEVRPEVVFHAAAYKHVPLMEECPELAIKNNVFGTSNAAQCALSHGVRRFVMISTDKAVNPTNVMGASKRVAELVVHSMNGHGTEFVAVRFGNVLASNGSVVPIFRRQIEAGGPVTVMHPDIIRYFMTIPEAARLVLQAGAMAKGGDTFVLDMGEPVKIVDLATTMIRMAGLVPGEDIRIEFTGLRPGEKLYEELLIRGEGTERTANDKIFVARSTVISPDERKDMLHRLQRAIDEKQDLRAVLRELLPEYTPEGG